MISLVFAARGLAVPGAAPQGQMLSRLLSSLGKHLMDRQPHESWSPRNGRAGGVKSPLKTGSADCLGRASPALKGPA